MAVSTSIWRDTSQSDFNKGELTSTSTTSKDELILGPSVELLYDSGQLYIWSLVVDGEGRIYAGCGNNGAIYKIEGGKGKLLYDSPEIAIHSLALDEEGNIYGGSSPRGIIYKVKTDGSSQVFCDLEEEYIWALLFDGQGNLLAGTGQRGRIYKISPEGEAKQIYDSPESHILSLAIDSEDNLYAGSEGEGIIYKITREGKVFALYDPPENEIHSLALDSQNNLYASAIEKGAMDEGPPFVVSPQPKEGMKEKGLSSLIYKITPQGDPVEWFRSKEAIIFSLTVDGEDNLYVGTGNQGLLYKINPEQEATTILKASEPQVLSLASGEKQKSIYFSTGNLGRLYEFSSIHYAREGIFESRVYDAKFITKWGNISWKGKMPRGTKITLTTRSGNTKKPGDTWSPWSREYKDYKGELVVSPPARFIQYRAALSTVNRNITPIITEVSLALLARNQAPQILAIKVPELDEKKPQGKEGKSLPPEVKGVAAKVKGNQGKQTISWEARDPNGDSLLYDLYFRGEEEVEWKELKKEIVENSYSWDSLTFPDGIYLARLVASDSPDNPPDWALTDEEISQPFIVDNTRPMVESLKATVSPDSRCIIEGEAVDNLCHIKSVAYSLDAGDWVAIHPVDEVFDCPREPFQFTVLELSAGEHTLVIKATDCSGNIGAAKIIFTTDKKSP
ncbi:hypothetical protein KAX00_00580 [bacterium]|nr:hypothetical protein [bacterium]